MSDNVTETPTTPTAPVPPITFEVNEFEDGEWKGFKFTTPTFNSMEAAQSTYGVDKVLSLLNTQIAARIRTKVKNGLPKNLKPTELAAKQQEYITKNGGLLFSQDEATQWRPEVRELSSNQLFKKAKEAFAAAGKETDPAKQAAMLAEGQRLLMQMASVLQS